MDLRDYWTKTDLDGEIRDEISGEVHTVDHRTRLVGAEPMCGPCSRAGSSPTLTDG